MAIFGRDKEQDERLDEIERQLRRVVEQVGQLTVDLGQTRMAVLKTQSDLDHLDPAWGQVDDLLKRSRQQLAETSAAADDAWTGLQARSDRALADLEAKLDSLSDTDD